MKVRTLLVIFAAVVVLSVLPVKAGCSPSHAFYSYDANTGAANYISFPADANMTFDPSFTAPTGGLVGRFWQAGARSTANESPTAGVSSGCLMETWLWTGPGGYYINGGLSGGTCDQTGCPANAMIILIEATSTDHTKGYFLVSKAVEDPGSPNAYYTYMNENTWELKPIPKPYVLNSTRAGGTVNLGMSMRDADIRPAYQPTGTYTDPSTVITGMKIYKYQGTADPGRLRTAWGTAVGTVAYTGADVPIAALAADCSNQLVDTFYAASLVFDGGQFESDFVSSAVKVNCNPALAEPGKYKKVDRKSQGRK